MLVSCSPRKYSINMISIGPYTHASRVVVAPMAGVTDRPFRDLCRWQGAHWVVSEMVTSDQTLWDTEKSRTRLAHREEQGLRWVQLAGTEPDVLAGAAQANVELGAQIIDINMGCPAKKVCSKAAGSALLRDPDLVSRILDAVVAAVEVPVSLKIRLGWSQDEINAPLIAHLAEQAGVQLLSVHGRTRACKFEGAVNYQAIRDVKEAVSIPVLANGDIDSPQKALEVLAMTSADGVMVGRAVQGRPWLIKQIDEFLQFGRTSAEPELIEIVKMLYRHVSELHKFYGDYRGLRVARKHVGWALKSFPKTEQWRREFNQIDHAAMQLMHLSQLLSAGQLSLGELVA